MKYFLFIVIALNLILFVGCTLDSFRDSGIDYTDDILALKAEKDNFMAERKKLADMVDGIIEKIKDGSIAANDAKTIFAEINKSKDKISESIVRVDAKISDMKDKAKEKSRETKVPWWAVFLGNTIISAIQVRTRTKNGLSEPGYKHTT